EVPAGRLDTVHAVAEVDDVHVVLEDLLFGELALEQSRQSELDELASQRAAVVAADEKAVARHLHRDGTEAFTHTHRRDVANDGAADATPIDAVMIEEAMILGGDECLPHGFGDLRQRNVDAAPDGQMSDEMVVLVEYASAFAGAIRAHLGSTGTTLKSAREEPA